MKLKPERERLQVLGTQASDGVSGKRAELSETKVPEKTVVFDNELARRGDVSRDVVRTCYNKQEVQVRAHSGDGNRGTACRSSGVFWERG
jgi:hypothetical protein